MSKVGWIVGALGAAALLTPGLVAAEDAEPGPERTYRPRLPPAFPRGRPHPATCGGIAGIPCPSGMMCVDNPRDDCDPRRGGADCGGVCVPAGSDRPDGPSHRSGCGTNACGAGEYCCNASCGICAPVGGVCTQEMCRIPSPGGGIGGPELTVIEQAPAADGSDEEPEEPGARSAREEE